MRVQRLLLLLFNVSLIFGSSFFRFFVRRAARTDANQSEIVTALRKMGCTVLCLHTVGKGCPDILVGYNGRNFLLEIKDGSKPPSARKLTSDEAVFFETWKGQAVVVNSVDEALELVKS